MTVEQQIADMQQASVEQTQASQALADEVAGKMGEIDSKVSQSQSDFESWKASAFQSEEAKNNVLRGSDQEIDLMHLSTELVYPIVFLGSPNEINHYEITRGYSHAGATSAGLFARLSWVGDTWGGNPSSLIIERCEQTYLVTLALAGFVPFYRAAVFLRGGYKYNLRSSNWQQQLQVFEQEGYVYQNLEDPQNDSKVGPVTVEAAALLPGAVAMTNIYNAVHNHNLVGVGEVVNAS